MSVGSIPKAQLSQTFCNHRSAIRKGDTRLWAAWCSYFCKHSTFQGRKWIKDDFYMYVCIYMGTAVAQWLKCCATNRKVAGSIPDNVTGFFIDIKFFRPHYGPGVDSASNRHEYQEYFLGVKAAGA